MLHSISKIGVAGSTTDYANIFLELNPYEKAPRSEGLFNRFMHQAALLRSRDAAFPHRHVPVLLRSHSAAFLCRYRAMNALAVRQLNIRVRFGVSKNLIAFRFRNPAFRQFNVFMLVATRAH